MYKLYIFRVNSGIMASISQADINGQNYCPNCGTPAKPEGKFCGECGATVKSEGPQAKSFAPSDWSAFIGALLLGPIWTIFFLQKGSIKLGWLAILGSIPVWLIAIYYFPTEIGSIFPNSNFRGSKAGLDFALLAYYIPSLILNLPLAIWASKQTELTRRKDQLKTLGIAFAGSILAFSMLMILTFGLRREKALVATAQKLSMAFVSKTPSKSRPGMIAYLFRFELPGDKFRKGPATYAADDISLLVSDQNGTSDWKQTLLRNATDKSDGIEIGGYTADLNAKYVLLLNGIEVQRGALGDVK
jgi:hypothetical protein